MIGEMFMSFVLCICNSTYSIMVGDSRMVVINENGECEPVEENIHKVQQINENVSIGYTGDPIPVLIAIKELDSYDRKNLTLGQVRKILFNKIKTLPINDLGVKLIISGKNRYGKMLMYVIDTKNNYKIEKYEPDLQKPAFSCAGQDYQIIKPVLDKYIFNTYPWDNIQQLENYMIKCVQEISNVDKTVNNNIKMVVII